MPIQPPSIVLAASEVVGYAKTGGLADVCGYLPSALAALGHPVSVIMPLYKSVRNGHRPIEPTNTILYVPLSRSTYTARVWKGSLAQNVPIYFIEQAELFERDDPNNGKSLYQYTSSDGEKLDYPDNALRFAFFSRAVLEAINQLNLSADVLHCNDWQTGLVPVYLREFYRNRPNFRRTRSLFTIHNLAYQGVFPYSDFQLIGLDARLFNHHQVEFYGKLNFLKSGIVFSDWINTVSPTYAQEIRTSMWGCGLEGVLNERRDRLTGIVNGVDYKSWDPETDPHLAGNYNIDNVLEGKAICKADLQKYFKLPLKARTPLLGLVARLVEQKGIDLIIKAADDILALETQLVILGDGEKRYQNTLMEIKSKYPEQVGLFLGFDESLAHRIEAGIDLFLMPSLYEPSGLNQLYSLKYGSPPIVRAVGGLADTVIPTTMESLKSGKPNGFQFGSYTPQALAATVDWAVRIYRDQPDDFLRIIRNGMEADWSWHRAAKSYSDLYHHLIAEYQGRLPRYAESA